MRKYLVAPVLLGAAFAVLYGVIGLVASVLKAFGWVEELRFHVVGVHVAGFALVVVSIGLILLAAAGMRYLTGGAERPT